jgi:hypothetical protein
MLRDTSPGAALPEGVRLRGIMPPMEGAGGGVDASIVPDAKPPKPFNWVVGTYF